MLTVNVNTNRHQFYLLLDLSQRVSEQLQMLVWTQKDESRTQQAGDTEVDAGGRKEVNANFTSEEQLDS